MNAIDPTGELIIFINGMHFGSGGKADYWEGFDRAVAAHLKDYRAIYRDGSVGGYRNVLNNVSSAYRMRNGEAQGWHDAEIIRAFITDKDNQPKETVKIISHSMGGAYAKGYVKALLEYFTMFNLPLDAIEFEADYAPYQPGEQEAVPGVDTYQFSHENDGIANKKIWGSVYAPIKGAKVSINYDKDKGHGIITFIDEINRLPTGTYKFVNGKIVPVE